MIAAALSMAAVWCLFYGRINLIVLAFLCAGTGALLYISKRHSHAHFFTIDELAQKSRLKIVNASLKFIAVIILMIICISAPNPAAGIFLSVSAAVFVICAGGLGFYKYLGMLTLPVAFLMMGGLVLLFEAGAPGGVLNIPLFGFWLYVTEETQNRAMLVLSRALGAIGCLYFLSLTTPMPELIGVLRRMRCPDVFITLMYLVYRYIFILFSMHHTMRNAAKSRLGYIDYPTSIRTTGNLYFNLLSRSYRQANKNFDAMESRCYDTEIRFLESREKMTGIQLAIAVKIMGIAICLCLLFN
jgi:cobalt/nickel transport system permease protein